MDRYRPPDAPAHDSWSGYRPLGNVWRLTAAFAAGIGLVGLPLAGVLSVAPQPFSAPTGKSPATDSAAANPQDPGRPGFVLPAVDGGGAPGTGGYMYTSPLVPLPQAPAAAIPPMVLSAYQHAAKVLARGRPRCRLTWPILAGIGKVESDHAAGGELQPDGTAVVPILGPELDGTNGNPAVRDTDHGALDGDAVWDRAVGPMQILPSVWKRAAATDRQGATPDPQNVFDATTTAAGLLCMAGGDLSTASGLGRAVSAYNHARGYAQAVLAWIALYAAATTGSAEPPFWPPLSWPPLSWPPLSWPTAPATASVTDPTASASPSAAPPSAPATASSAGAGPHGFAGSPRPLRPPGFVPTPVTTPAQPPRPGSSSPCTCPPVHPGPGPVRPRQVCTHAAPD